MNSRTLRGAVGLGGLLATVGLAFCIVQGAIAQSNEEARETDQAAAPAAPGPAIPMEQALAQLDAEGYSETYQLVRGRSSYEVDAKNGEGRTVELSLDAPDRQDARGLGRGRPSSARRGAVAGAPQNAYVASMRIAQQDSVTMSKDDQAVATFAGGCFWCMEPPYDKLDGVLATTSGYTGGSKADPTYKEVSAGGTGHAEAVQVTYDPSKVSYEKLLEVFWRNVDPLDAGGQFCDRGDQYRTGIFVHDDDQRRLAEASKKALEDSGRFERPIVTEIEEAGPFYPAEDYHQDYYEKNPIRYNFYRWNCGRDARLEQLWGEQSTH